MFLPGFFCRAAKSRVEVVKGTGEEGVARVEGEERRDKGDPYIYVRICYRWFYRI